MYQRVDDEITIYQRAKIERIALRDKRSIDQKWLFNKTLIWLHKDIISTSSMILEEIASFLNQNWTQSLM